MRGTERIERGSTSTSTSTSAQARSELVHVHEVFHTHPGDVLRTQQLLLLLLLLLILGHVNLVWVEILRQSPHAKKLSL